MFDEPSKTSHGLKGESTTKEGGSMENVRCKCGKIVCQLKGKVVLIKCRHCKRFVILEFSDQEGQETELAKESRPKIEYK